VTDNQQQQWAPGHALQQAREYAGLSKREAAKRAGLSSASYRWVEYGTRTNNGVVEEVNPSAEALQACATAVGADPHHVLRLAGIDPTTLSRRELHEAVEKLPPEMVEPALRMVRGLATED